MGIGVSYKTWQHMLFWLVWLSLLIPLYYVGTGFYWLNYLVAHGYTEQLDILLAVVFGLTFFTLLILSYRQFRNFWFKLHPFKHIVWNVIGTLLGVPFVSSALVLIILVNLRPPV